MQSMSCEAFTRIHRNLTGFIKSAMYIQVKHNRNNQYPNCSLRYREGEASSFCKRYFVLHIKIDAFPKNRGKDL